MGKALSEAQKINTSLLALGNVIQALTSKPGGASHVPFRDSVLTRILQQSIGGNCKTCLIVCASPADGDVTETLSTLRFASRAKKVKLHAKVNATIEATALQADALAEQIQTQLDKEKTRLEKARAESERVAANAIGLAFKLGHQNRKVTDRRRDAPGAGCIIPGPVPHHICAPIPSLGPSHALAGQHRVRCFQKCSGASRITHAPPGADASRLPPPVRAGSSSRVGVLNMAGSATLRRAPRGARGAAQGEGGAASACDRE